MISIYATHTAIVSKDAFYPGVRHRKEVASIGRAADNHGINSFFDSKRDSSDPKAGEPD